ncbi:hypothetical protein B0H15DRAFT_950717 [Mycena belliarum]|uniref:Uncharacterized protein n=1 Tax=Mycena belliarum TaxID=1033014 RepID=A0AAD6U0V6_9AGAR|nr:hypothetical protein B0H15DRAFT_950717 [Mycena belliae]
MFLVHAGEGAPDSVTGLFYEQLCTSQFPVIQDDDDGLDQGVAPSNVDRCIDGERYTGNAGNAFGLRGGAAYNASEFRAIAASTSRPARPANFAHVKHVLRNVAQRLRRFFNTIGRRRQRTDAIPALRLAPSRSRTPPHTVPQSFCFPFKLEISVALPASGGPPRSSHRESPRTPNRPELRTGSSHLRRLTSTYGDASGGIIPRPPPRLSDAHSIDAATAGLSTHAMARVLDLAYY